MKQKYSTFNPMFNHLNLSHKSKKKFHTGKMFPALQAFFLRNSTISIYVSFVR